jgi:hypothetical protein
MDISGWRNYGGNDKGACITQLVTCRLSLSLIQLF